MEKPERRDVCALTVTRFLNGKSLRDTLSGRCCRIAPGFWPNISIVSTGEPSAECFDRLSPRQLAHDSRVLALGVNISLEPSNIISRFPVRTQSSSSGVIYPHNEHLMKCFVGYTLCGTSQMVGVAHKEGDRPG